MRLVFCAASVCYILNDFSYIDVDSACQFIRKCFNYDGGFGQLPHLESHGGSSYCAVASLALFGRLWDESVLTRQQLEILKRWALMKQDKGFHGRVNKPDDTCYAFWIGAILSARRFLFKSLTPYLFSDLECTKLG
jgi:geranylgeranyl transferase type-1 subunit beta